MGGNNSNEITDKRLISKIYKQTKQNKYTSNLCNSIPEKDTTQSKSGHKQTFLQRRHTDDQRRHTDDQQT